MKSLVIASAPRSASTLIYAASKLALSHELNSDWAGHAASGGEVVAHNLVLDMPVKQAQVVVADFCVNHSEGFLWKHAANPWLLKEVKPTGANLLYLHRNPADCVFHCLEMGWIWPALVLPVSEEVVALCKRVNDGPITRSLMVEILPWVVDGIIAAQTAYLDIADERIYWDHVTQDPGVLFTALENLGYHPRWHDYTSENFRSVKAKRLSCRETELWQIAEKVCWLRGDAAQARARSHWLAL